jgi:hypothetical protein
MPAIIRRMTKRTHSTLPVVISLALVLAGCNLPEPRPTQPSVTVLPNGETPAVDGGSAAPGSLTATPTADAPAATSTPAGDPPEGWLDYTNPETSLRFYYPPDWEVSLPQPHQFDVRSADGTGWFEIIVLDAANVAEVNNLPVATLSDAEAAMQLLLGAAQEDGEFSPIYQVETRFGMDAWATQGTYDALEDRVWFAIMEQRNRAVLVRGHAAESVEGWETSLIPIYEQILWSIEQTAG